MPDINKEKRVTVCASSRELFRLMVAARKNETTGNLKF